MAVQFNALKPAGRRLFQSVIFSPNLAMLHVLNEKSGNVKDRCLVNRLDGTVNGNPTYSKAIGDLYGLDLDGTGDFVNLGNVPSLDFERTASFSGLCVVTVGLAGSLISKRLSTGDLTGWDWHFKAGRIAALILQNAVGNRIEVSANSALTLDASYMLGFSYSGSSTAAGATLYVNGAAVADTDTEDTLSSSIVASALASIGARNASDQVLDGDVGFVALWSGRALAAQEFKLYASLSGFL